MWPRWSDVAIAIWNRLWSDVLPNPDRWGGYCGLVRTHLITWSFIWQGHLLHLVLDCRLVH